MRDLCAGLRPKERARLERLADYAGCAVEDLVTSFAAGYLQLIDDARKAVPEGALSQIVKRAKGTGAS